MGTPVVTTTVGSEGIDVEDGRHLLVADGADAFAHSILRLLGDRGLAQRLSREGRQLVIERYSWTEILESVENLYYELARARASVGTPRAGKAAGAS
jgi:glycosyltransferase involved in cell wall biosynthesis